KTLMAFENQGYQYEQLVEDLKIIRDPGRNPLFDVVFTFQNMESNEIQVSDIKFLPFKYANPSTKFDLILAITEIDKKLGFSFNYSTRLFKEEMIEKFVDYLKNIIEYVVQHPAQPMSKMDILSDQ